VIPPVCGRQPTFESKSGAIGRLIALLKLPAGERRRAEAAFAACEFSMAEQAPALVEAGAIGALLSVLADGTAQECEFCSVTLGLVGMARARELIAAGGVEALFGLLAREETTDAAREYAALAVASLAEADRRATIGAARRHERGLEPLVRCVLAPGSTSSREAAAGALVNLAEDARSGGGGCPVAAALAPHLAELRTIRESTGPCELRETMDMLVSAVEPKA